MTIGEKRTFLDNYCNVDHRDCEKCILNDKSHNWKEPCVDGVDCLKFANSDEEDLDKAIKLIQGLEDLDNVNHPRHYQGKNECIDVMVAMFGVEAVKHFCMCNAYKYRFRSNMKNGEEDIKKAEWYENKLIELGGVK